jgi:signal transduction histidine kinase
LATRWKKYSYSLTAKIVAFIITILCFSSALTIFLDIIDRHDGNFDIALEKDYYLGEAYITDSSEIMQNLRTLTDYQSEEYIKSGGTVTQDELSNKENELFNEFQYDSKSYNPNLSTAENYQIFKQVYADRITQARDQLIQEDLNAFRTTLRSLDEYSGICYYAKKGDIVFTNSPNENKSYFKSFPSYMVFDSSEQSVFPDKVKQNRLYYWVEATTDSLGSQDFLYLGFSWEFLDSQIAAWEKDKQLVTRHLYEIGGFLAALLLALVYLIVIIGRKPEEQDVHLNGVDKIYNDINLGLCFILIALWVGAIVQLEHLEAYNLVFPLTLIISAAGLILVLALIKHIKNRTFWKHTVIYIIFHKVWLFAKDVYNSGNVAVKVVLIVIGYPIIAALTFFLFPITVGVAAWLALKKVKEFNAIKEGVKKVKEGDFHYDIAVPGEGELARLAADINSITDGLNKAVENEIKSERLKAELITNVSHDIRTPLTSIITYVDLLKNEPDQDKAGEYIEIIDQKAQRLKTLTDDLFEATKASSGNIPVNLERIDLVSLITQGLGEFDDKIQERRLDFKISHPADKVFIEADGKLLWRAIENLLLNIFKYALEGSRVYIDVVDSGAEILLVIKNISAYELNISPDELMERFKRGDVARTSPGSGLGLAIAKSLVEIQKGSFNIEVDGDLFKAVLKLPKSSQVS